MASMRQYYRDFREHLTALEERSKLVRIKRAINKDTELAVKGDYFKIGQNQTTQGKKA